MTSRNCIECTKLKLVKRASFNIAGEKKALYCGTHKTPGMINVNQKAFCITCGKNPSFNYPGETKALYCSDDKLKGMVNVVHKNSGCKNPNGCPNKVTYATFNYPDKTKGEYCKECSLEGMVDVKNKKNRCVKCNKHQASYNLPNEKIAKYCKECSTDDMVDVRRPVHEYCITCVSNCDRKDWVRACYNVIGEKKPLYCLSHKNDGMVDIISKRCKDCDKQPTYNYPDFKYGIYCASHYKDGMENVSGVRCVAEGCYNIPYYHNAEKYKGHCLRCFIHYFPDEPISRNYKTKELSVVEFVKTTFPDWTYSCDKKIQDGCSQRRPDIYVDFGNFVLIVEVDEGEHNRYESICENKRLMELSQDIGHRPMVMIRFNRLFSHIH